MNVSGLRGPRASWGHFGSPPLLARGLGPSECPNFAFVTAYLWASENFGGLVYEPFPAAVEASLCT